MIYILMGLWFHKIFKTRQWYDEIDENLKNSPSEIISTHCEDSWSGKSWWHLKAEKDRRLFYCVVLWYQGEALLKIRADRTRNLGCQGTTYSPSPPNDPPILALIEVKPAIIIGPPNFWTFCRSWRWKLASDVAQAYS